MEKIMTRLDNGSTMPKECCDPEYLCTEDCGDCKAMNKAFERLAEYEDTGLPPEEVKNLLVTFVQTLGECVSFARIRELIRADREERLLVLPCAIGTPVYVHNALCDVGGRATFTSLTGCKYAQDCQRNPHIKCPLRVVKRPFAEKMRKELGITFWLTKEEAEAAIPADRKP